MQVFLSLAFGIEGFLMVLHKKHTPLDMITHELLGYTMLAGSFGVLLELRARGEFLISVFRSFAVMVQGVWLIAVSIQTCRNGGSSMLEDKGRNIWQTVLVECFRGLLVEDREKLPSKVTGQTGPKPEREQPSIFVTKGGHDFLNGPRRGSCGAHCRWAKCCSRTASHGMTIMAAPP